MAIVPTGAIYKSLVFDGESSRDYGIYITGQAVYNAPERDVEMINIPGRNGSFALDKGRFQNIEVTYPAGIFADNEADFAQGISDFRNFLCSRNGYVRLTDDYNPNEYRMAVYKSGLDVSPAQLKAGEFDITFDCKPQRYLLSGEEPQTIGEWRETETASGSIASFEAKDGDAVKSLVVDIEPMQSGSGTPSPTNVRPISGYDSVVVSRCGKNFLPIRDNEQTLYGITVKMGNFGVTLSDTATANVTILPKGADTESNKLYLPEGEYIISGMENVGSSGSYVGVNVNSTSGTYTATSKGTNTFTINKGDYAYVRLRCASGDTFNNVTVYPMIRLASEADDTYEPYQSNTYTTNLNGTRYGGTLDVVSGVLTVTHGYVDLGTLTWTASGSSLPSGTFHANISGGATASNPPKDAVCSQYAPYIGGASGLTDGSFSYANSSISSSAGRVFIHDSTYASSTAAQFKTAMSGVQFVYELATPTTVQLTAQEVELLVGLNQIWANSGDVEVEYGTAPNVVYNPTLFESSPMLEVEGYGTIAFNGYEIELTNDYIGDILLLGATNDKTYIYYDGSLVNTNDVVTIHDHRNLRFRTNVTTASYTPTSATLTRTTSNIPGTFSYTATLDGRNFILDLFYSGSDTFSYGTNSTKTDTFTLNIGYTDGNTSGTLTRTFNVTQRATSRYVQTYSTEDTSGGIQIYGSRCSYGEITAYSTQTILGHPTYVECDIGVCYKEVDGEAVSLNQYIDLGSDLPKLASGANTITADNTVTNLKVVPRYWKV